MGFFSKFKLKFGNDSEVEEEKEEGYVELGTDEGDQRAKITVRPYVLHDFDSIRPILDVLREGNTIALVNIKPLKDKDLVELKRAINKLKKTCDAVDGDIAGFGEDWIAAVPNFAKIYRQKPEQKKEDVPEVTEYGTDESME